ncbi:uncharacterized protein LOC122623079 [Drosophila teissieri]|uniref:uncharacterized protein LOC122623079 n=1 Tax=Drosophila teissieri TaxID=7243 RepID=UPI001CBA0FB7|nr:uncharacterized protein LOC122623079 [Drosophila teissieri]
MPPKKAKKGAGSKKKEEELENQPQPPNVFLYIQLAVIANTPSTQHPLEIHISQGGSLLVKCDEHYNTDGIIVQEEFHSKPTFTLIFQQDNVDRINHAADNPLLIQLYMRVFPPRRDIPVEYEMQEEQGEEEERDLESDSDSILTVSTGRTATTQDDVLDDVFGARETVKLVLLCVGYLDVIKLFGHRRSMICEELFLYPMPDVPNEMRATVHTEWHLYTLLPIAKKLTFTNMAFVTFESIYCLKDEYVLDLDTLWVRLSFRSRLPGDRNDYTFIPLCEFGHLQRKIICLQDNHHVFESFRRSVSPWNVTGLKSAMEIQMHRLFSELFYSETMTPDFEEIDAVMDEALVCNSFHRFILTQSMADILSYAITCQQYVLVVEAFQTFGAAKPQKVFQGVLDPSIMAFPGVQNMRFAVQLDYLGKLRPKKMMSTTNVKAVERTKTLPTFAIIKLCLLAPIGEIYKELKVFRDSFIRQNRLLFCDRPLRSKNVMTLGEIQMESYARFDKFIRDCISFIIDKKVMKLEDKKQHFCCAVQNLTNILMKLVGSVYNTRTLTHTSVEFANLCAFAYNELEPRVHIVVEQIENEGFDSYTISKQIQMERIIDYLNTVKLLLMVNDENLANLLMEKAITEYPSNERFWFYMVIAYMERGDLEKAKVYFKKNHLADTHDYFAGWIKLYINYVDTRNNPETAPDCIECLLRSITNYAERYPRQQDAWILLYCYYKRFNYEPGCAFAHWRFEDHHGHCRLNASSNAPHSLWGLYVNLKITIPTSRGNMFLEVFRTFARLGLYEFAQVVFAAVEHLAGDADRYMLQTQMDMMLNQLDEEFVPQSFDFEEDEEGDYLAAMNAQINGNVEFYRGNLEEAALYYESALTLPTPEVNERDFFEVSRLRLGYISYELGNYNKCIEALNFPFAGQLLSIVANYMIGKSYYKLDQLEMALESFVSATHLDTHVPNVWGFLALINLRLGENYKAIECWKYAKIEPNYAIDDMMIYEELDAIDYDSVDLYIDVPNQMVDDIFRDSQSDS